MYCMSLHRSDCQIMIMYNAVTQYLRQTLDSSSNFGKGQSSLLCIDGIQIQSWVYCLQAAQIRTWNSYNYYLLHAKHTVWFPLYVSYQHGKAFSANKRITPTISMDFLYSTEPKTLPRPQRGKFQRLTTKQTQILLPPGRSWGYKHATYINWCPNAWITQSKLEVLPLFISLPLAAVRLDHPPSALSCSVWTGAVWHLSCKVPEKRGVDIAQQT